MDETIFSEYLKHPTQIKKALELLEQQCEELEFFPLLEAFDNALGIKPGDGFPITRAFISDQLCRARINNTTDFKAAEKLNQINVKLKDISQGRANPLGIPIFYASNSRDTACFEVLQNEEPGIYKITIGIWKSPRELILANLLDGSDPDLSEIKFAHSMPKKYVTGWPEPEKESTLMLHNYFREKFKIPRQPGLYNLTNVIAEICYSLKDVDGIGYASVSNLYKGYNIALKNYSMIECDSVEEWLINKVNSETLDYRSLRKGFVNMNGTITWDVKS